MGDNEKPAEDDVPAEEYIPQTGPAIIHADHPYHYRESPKVEKEVTDEDRREFLRNPGAPQAVKRILKQHLFGRVDGRREVRHALRSSEGYKFTVVPPGAKLKANKLQKPAEMSGRQFKKLRKAALRELRRSTAHE